MQFLDDFVHSSREPLDYELWLRRLSVPADEARFVTITRGLVKYACAKAQFYSSVERGAQRESAAGELVVVPSTARHPLTARFGLYDLYFFARLLRAEVSPTGAVTFTDGSWLAMLMARAPDVISQPFISDTDALPLRDCETLIQAVLDYTCDLIKNGVDIANDRLEAGSSSTVWTASPPTTVGWRSMYDEELDEIERRSLAQNSGR
jgi:hypothetical protein